MNDLTIWEKRWESTNNTLSLLLKKFNNGSHSDLPRRAAIGSLLNNLQAFGQSHFDFFYQGFQGNRNVMLKDEKKEYPKASVLRWITEQIAFDLTIISRAWDQRQSNSIYAEALKKADELGCYALLPAVRSGLVDPNTSILSYFQKSYSVRLIPYTNIALIGLPLTALTVPRDYLAIPHEVGHYIFRHGNLPNNKGKYLPENRSISSTLKDQFGDRPEYLANWVEEIFADMYGCIVAGPAMALDFQDLQMDDPLEEFADGRIDYEDPVPLIRPDTYVKVLAQFGTSELPGNPEWPRLAGLLHERWKLYRDRYWAAFTNNHGHKFGSESVPTELAFLAKNEPDPVMANDIREGGPLLKDGPFDQIITIIWNNILKNAAVHVQENDNANIIYWSGNTAKLKEIQIEQEDGNFTDEDIPILDKALENLYENFISAVTNSQTVSISQTEPQMAERPALKPIWTKWKDNWPKRKGYRSWNPKKEEKSARLRTNNGSIASMNNRGERNTNTNGETRPNNERDWGWIELAYADGWITRGPEPNPVGDGVDVA